MNVISIDYIIIIICKMYNIRIDIIFGIICTLTTICGAILFYYQHNRIEYIISIILLLSTIIISIIIFLILFILLCILRIYNFMYNINTIEIDNSSIHSNYTESTSNNSDFELVNCNNLV